MSRHHSRLWGLALALPLVAVLTTSCGNDAGGDPLNAGAFRLELISTGQGQVWPYRIRELDFDGTPSNRITNIESQAELDLASMVNPVLPIARFPEQPTLISGDAGNHYLYFRFSNALDPTSILSLLPSDQQLNSGLSTSISILAYDPATESTQTLPGRGFVGGMTTVRNPDGSISLVEAVSAEDGDIVIEDPIANGFPSGFFGDEQLVTPFAFVFVADTDGDLSTIERFDPNEEDLVIQIRVNNTVLNTSGQLIENDARVATSVGPDPNPANVVGFSQNRLLRISPGNGETNVAPLEPILIEFNKPVQPTDVGTYFTRTNLAPASGGITLSVTLANNVFTALYYADPVSPGDLMTYRITPAFDLPGNEDITVSVIASQITDVEDLSPLGQDVSTMFRTGNGRGLVNAPVAPDAVYIGVDGVEPGISVLDLNGFGQGTNGLQPDANGDPTLPPEETFFALNNPNIGQPGVTPSLAPGTSPVDAGSNGPFTLTEDTTGNTVLIGSPLLAGVEDIQIGSPLDIVFNNAGLNPNAGGQNQTNPITGTLQPGNTISAAPHPNPPRLRFPPPNPGQAIFGEEPTNGGQNQLIPGVTPGYRVRTGSGFNGPAAQPPSPPPPLVYTPYSYRQQIGHFLYVLDRASAQIVVLNSNRMTVLDTISLPDPVDMAIAPSLGLMAVANFASSTLSIVDIDPRSATFHEVIATTQTAEGPIDVVWQPDGETILAVCSIDQSVTVVNGTDFRVQKIAAGQISDPVGMVVTQRFTTTGNTSNLYYAYILNGDGTVTVFESGPDGTNGIGFNDIIGIIQPVFASPTAIVYDYNSAFGGFWVAHRDSLGVAVVSRVELTGSPQGPQPLQQNSTGVILPPTFRQKEWTVTDRIGGLDPTQPVALRLSGNSIGTIAFDDLVNNGGNPNQQTLFSGDLGFSIYGHSSKGAVLGGAPAITPSLMFITYSDVGKLDVIDLVARARLTTIDVPGARIVANYWRQ